MVDVRNIQMYKDPTGRRGRANTADADLSVGGRHIGIVRIARTSGLPFFGRHEIIFLPSVTFSDGAAETVHKGVRVPGLRAGIETGRRQIEENLIRSI